jgi:KaiC/GvpD/RAD55 family RecA-like ATPase
MYDEYWPVEAFDDLNRFIKLGNRSLLIKGKSGTGKVTLALELARNHADKFEIVFISRKMTEFDLHNRFPWVKNLVNPHNILSTSGMESAFDDPSFTITNVINSITNRVTKVDDPFISLKEDMKPFVILDVWDTIAKVDVATRIRAEKLLISLTDKHVGFLVFLTENVESPTVEYLVDGVVSLSQSFYKSYRLREMDVEKLRGTHISKAKVSFTLQGGRFRIFSKLSHRIAESPKKFSPIKNSETFYSTGNADLDERLNGGFRRGSIISVEMDDDVDRFVFVPLLGPLALNFISQGNGALVIPASDQDVSAVTRYLSPYTEEDSLMKFLRLYGSIDETRSAMSPYMVQRATESFEEAYGIWTGTYRELREKTGGCVVTMDYSFVELEYQNEIQSILKSIIKMSNTIRSLKDLLVMVSRPGYRSLEVIKKISDIHLRIFEYDGTTMLAAVKPQLFLFNIQTDYSQGFPSASLQEST